MASAVMESLVAVLVSGGVELAVDDVAELDLLGDIGCGGSRGVRAVDVRHAGHDVGALDAVTAGPWRSLGRPG